MTTTKIPLELSEEAKQAVVRFGKDLAIEMVRRNLGWVPCVYVLIQEIERPYHHGKGDIDCSIERNVYAVAANKEILLARAAELNYSAPKRSGDRDMSIEINYHVEDEPVSVVL